MSDCEAVFSVEASLKSLDLSIGSLDKEIKHLQVQLKSKIDERDRLIKGRQRMTRLVAGSSVDQEKKESLGDEHCFHVLNLNTYTTKKTLIEYFGQFGAVSEVRMTMNGMKNSGDAYVSFATISDYESLFNFEHFVAGSLLKVQQVNSNSDNAKNHQPKYDDQTRSIMVSGYLTRITEKDLRDHFSKYGKIVKYSDTSSNKKRNDGYRYVFIKFANYEVAEKAAAENQQLVQNFNVTVKKAKDM